MLRRAAALAAIFLVASSLTARAADPTSVGATPIKDAAARAANIAVPEIDVWALREAAKRPATLTALYGTYGAIQAMDIVSTRRALAAGATERNPLMHGGNVGAMLAVKAATGASTIFFAERMWKKNRVGAVIVMAALNGASAAIVARNQRNARR